MLITSLDRKSRQNLLCHRYLIALQPKAHTSKGGCLGRGKSGRIGVEGNMKPKKSKPYNPELELAKGATLDAASYDKTQKIKVTVPKVTVGGISGRVEISGTATGRIEPGIDGTMNL